MCELAVHLPDLMWTFMSAEDSEITSDEEHVSSKGVSMLMQASGAKPAPKPREKRATTTKRVKGPNQLLQTKPITHYISLFSKNQPI